jgi:hypothetical protein
MEWPNSIIGNFVYFSRKKNKCPNLKYCPNGTIKERLEKYIVRGLWEHVLIFKQTN